MRFFVIYVVAVPILTVVYYVATAIGPNPLPIKDAFLVSSAIALVVAFAGWRSSQMENATRRLQNAQRAFMTWWQQP